jgi:hypothetical protein
MRGACYVRTPWLGSFLHSVPVLYIAPQTHIRCSKARIILADEAAAHVDDETENKISLAFVRAAGQGRTVLSVAHRCVWRSCGGGWRSCGAVGRRGLCGTT